MENNQAIRLFDDKQIRYVWDGQKEKYFFSIVDVIQVLTETPNPRKYWSVLKTRLKKEGSELATNCSQLKMPSSDGKKYLTDVADTEQILRLVQSARRIAVQSKRRIIGIGTFQAVSFGGTNFQTGQKKTIPFASRPNNRGQSTTFSARCIFFSKNPCIIQKKVVTLHPI